MGKLVSLQERTLSAGPLSLALNPTNCSRGFIPLLSLSDSPFTTVLSGLSPFEKKRNVPSVDHSPG
uniref:Uncharacterized protein n=1 Tax=Anguilla anguilla TaxID=7936 RepID=A0A0E9RC60_ANGAN